MSHCPGIVPPYIVSNIEGQLELDEAIRRRRASSPVVRGTQGAETTTANPQRSIYDARNAEDLPGTLVRSEGSAAGSDVAVNEAYDGLGATFAFYWDVFSRNSIDGNGLPLLGTVHYGQDYDNAFWDGERMIFGDGDGTYFNRFTISVDVIGHELTHGVTGAEVNLDYEGQSGALNESVSDVFGSLVKQYAASETAAAADWLIGEGLFTSRVSGAALRSMKAPGTAYADPVLGTDPQPDSMSGYVDTDEDNGGVHINSGIPNRAFYLVATGLGGSSWEKAGPIWYATISSSSLSASASFAEFAAETVASAGSLYDASVAAVVTSAWQTVGVSV